MFSMSMGIKPNSYSRSFTYTLGKDKAIIKTSELERDLGVLLSNDLKWGSHCRKVAATANRVLGRLKHTFVNRSSVLWKKIYIAYVRPHLEFAAQIWSPYLECDIKTIEAVQRRATRTPHKLRDKPYEERCRLWNIQTLRRRRVRGDLIQKFKIEKNLDKVNWFMEPPAIFKPSGRKKFHREPLTGCDQRYEFFNKSSKFAWNALPEWVVEVENVGNFKKIIDDLST